LRWGLSARLLEMFPFSFDHLIESRVEAITYALQEGSDYHAGPGAVVGHGDAVEV
jgi:hypothetical protein